MATRTGAGPRTSGRLENNVTPPSETGMLQCGHSSVKNLQNCYIYDLYEAYTWVCTEAMLK